MSPICGCNKDKNGKMTQFIVVSADGKTKTVNSEQEARSIVRISGGSYTKK